MTEMMSPAEVARMLAGASDEAVRVAVEVLAEDASNAAWRAQVGPCLTQGAAADILGITPQGVAKRADAAEILRVPNGDGRPAYPMFQFHGRGVLDGLPAVLRRLRAVDEALTVASWLTTPKRSLSGRTPVEELRGGGAEAVLAAADDYLARSA